MKFAQLFTLVASIMISTKVSGQDLPSFIEQLIEKYEAASEGQAVSEGMVSPVEIWQYEYNGEPVFYLPLSRSFCCDVLSVLYNAEGAVICRPDGGFTGDGDGRCSNFVAQRSSGVLVWRGVRAGPGALAGGRWSSRTAPVDAAENDQHPEVAGDESESAVQKQHQ